MIKTLTYIWLLWFKNYNLSNFYINRNKFEKKIKTYVCLLFGAHILWQQHTKVIGIQRFEIVRRYVIGQIFAVIKFNVKQTFDPSFDNRYSAFVGHIASRRLLLDQFGQPWRCEFRGLSQCCIAVPWIATSAQSSRTDFRKNLLHHLAEIGRRQRFNVHLSAVDAVQIQSNKIQLELSINSDWLLSLP